MVRLRLGLVCNPHKPHTLEVAREWAELAARHSAPRPRIVVAHHDYDVLDLMPEVDLLVTLGGDGTLIRTARLAAPYRIPTLGVRFGVVGFLSSVKPSDFPTHLPRLLAGEFWVEDRAMVRGEHRRGETILSSGEALNDVVVSRGRTPRVIHLGTYVDGALLDNFVCDGAIVATATGSTAYSLASGGPILVPTETSMLLTLISPYLSPIRSLVIPRTACISFRLSSPTPASLTMDGQEDHELLDGDEVRVVTAEHTARFARVQSRTYFYETIRDRLRRQD